MKALVLLPFFLALAALTACGPHVSGNAPTTLNAGFTTPILVTPTNANIPIFKTQQITVTGGVGQYHFTMLSGGGTVGFYSGLYSAPGVASTASILVTDATGRTSTVTILVAGGSTTPAPGTTASPTNCSAMLSAPNVAFYDSSLGNPSVLIASQGLVYGTSANIADPTSCSNWCSQSGAGACMWSPGSNSSPVCIAWPQGVSVTPYQSLWTTYAASCQ